ncbi:MAG: DUF5615 family PIN-like protein [Lentisphaeria bacterium]|nr:DUF5615 family PIN-like protein [Lentisphaeria bacterium]
MDENFPRSAADMLVAMGHEVLDVRGSEKEGVDDSALFGFAQKNTAVLLTTDRDFFHTVPWQSPINHGVVVIALRQPNRERILKRLRWFLQHFGTESLVDRVFLLRDTTYIVSPGHAETFE